MDTKRNEDRMMTMQKKIAAMQEKRKARPEMWQNDNGTWSHTHDAQREWEHKDGCMADLRFSKNWYRGRA